MKKFRTDSTDHYGKKHSQLIEAKDERDVVAKLKIAGLSPVKIEAIEPIEKIEAIEPTEAVPAKTPKADLESESQEKPHKYLDTFSDEVGIWIKVLNTLCTVACIVFGLAAFCLTLYFKAGGDAVASGQFFLAGLGGCLFIMIAHRLSMISMQFMQACAEGIREIRKKEQQ